jgi:hypothetical protein
MKQNTPTVFEPTRISGTSTVQSSALHMSLGAGANTLLLYEINGVVSGTNPTLTIVVEDSPDGRNFFTVATPISASAMSNGSTHRGVVTSSTPFGPYVRFSLALGGTNPVANLVVYCHFKMQ